MSYSIHQSRLVAKHYITFQFCNWSTSLNSCHILKDFSRHNKFLSFVQFFVFQLENTFKIIFIGSTESLERHYSSFCHISGVEGFVHIINVSLGLHICRNQLPFGNLHYFKTFWCRGWGFNLLIYFYRICPFLKGAWFVTNKSDMSVSQ